MPAHIRRGVAQKPRPAVEKREVFYVNFEPMLVIFTPTYFLISPIGTDPALLIIRFSI